MVVIYTLALEHNKYYVGKTTNINFRLENHFNSNGSVWTKKYSPLRVIELIQDCDNYDEDKYTIKYMVRYGIDNVRGGSYCQMELEEWQIKSIKHQCKTVTDVCYECGEIGHFASECKKQEKVTPSIIFSLKKISPKYTSCGICSRCINCVVLFTRTPKYINDLKYFEWYVGECCYSKIKDEKYEFIHDFLMEKGRGWCWANIVRTINSSMKKIIDKYYGVYDIYLLDVNSEKLYLHSQTDTISEKFLCKYDELIKTLINRKGSYRIYNDNNIDIYVRPKNKNNFSIIDFDNIKKEILENYDN